MGGLAGHMMHPYENLDLTIGDLKRMCKDSLNGKIQFKEKIDGLNITCILSKDGIKLARNKKDIETGGFELQDISSRFDNQNVINVYTSSISYLIKDLTEFIQDSPKFDGGELLKNLEKGAVFKLNVECVGDYIPNLINYQGSIKYVVHNVDSNGFPAYLLEDYFSSSQRRAHLYSIGSKYSNNIYIDELFDYYEMTDESQTIYEYAYIRFLRKYSFPIKTDATRAVFDKIMDKDPINIREIRHLWELKGYDMDLLSRLIENKLKIKKDLLLNLKNIVLKIGSELIANVIPREDSLNQCFITNDVEYIWNHLDNKDFGEWGYCARRIPRLEGLVFEYKGNTYKWTGAFAILNRNFGGPKKDDIRKHAGLD